MCGIGGVILSDETYRDMDPQLTADLARSLGWDLEHRGTDATGVARLTGSNRIKVSKAPEKASRFFKTHKGVGERARALLVHTRARTQGDERNPLNNHPIVYNTIIGIHNGWISNDDDLFKDYGWVRPGEVDSAALFAAIHHLGVEKALESIEGTAACAWFDQTTERFYLARQNDYSPLRWGQTPMGDFVFASTATAVDNAMKIIEFGSLTGCKTGQIEVGKGMWLTPGVREVEAFEFEPKPYSYTRKTNYYGTWEWADKDHLKIAQDLASDDKDWWYKKGAEGDDVLGPPDGQGIRLKKGDKVLYLPASGEYADTGLDAVIDWVGYKKVGLRFPIGPGVIASANVDARDIVLLDRPGVAIDWDDFEAAQRQLNEQVEAEFDRKMAEEDPVTAEEVALEILNNLEEGPFDE